MAVFVAPDVNNTETYLYLAEFKESREAYQFAGDLRGSGKYKEFSIILEDIWRESGQASKKMVRRIFTPEGSVIEADEAYWRGETKEDWWVHGFI